MRFVEAVLYGGLRRFVGFLGALACFWCIDRVARFWGWYQKAVLGR